MTSVAHSSENNSYQLMYDSNRFYIVFEMCFKCLNLLKFKCEKM